ncbi:hypothetical protein ACN47E_000976 [Coniothyrium glycines]
MKPAQILLACSALGACASTTETSTSTSTSEAAIKSMPACALSCLSKASTHSNCEPTDRKCICTDVSLLHNVESCVISTCTIKEALVTKNITATLCGAPIRNISERTRRPNIFLSVVTATIGLARLLYNAIFSPSGWMLDDYTVLAVLIAGAPSVVIIDRMSIPNGLGKDVWTVPFDNITTFVRSIYALEILYFLQLFLIKGTLLFFFLRIFSRQLTGRLIRYTIVFNILYGLSFTIVAIFPCRPISFYWTKFGGETAGQCVDINALVWTNAGIGIILDIWMLALPLYEVFRLQMSWRKRVSVALMFFVGTFVTIVSIIRLRFLVTFAKGNNPTWDQSDVVNWSNIEINVGILCTCMPTLRMMLVRLSPRIPDSARTGSLPHVIRVFTRSKDNSDKGDSMDSVLGDLEFGSTKELNAIDVDRHT